jgi:hypothetical protein
MEENGNKRSRWLPRLTSALALVCLLGMVGLGAWWLRTSEVKAALRKQGHSSIELTPSGLVEGHCAMV